MPMTSPSKDDDMWLIVVKTFNGFPLEYYTLDKLAEALAQPIHQKITLYQVFDSENRRAILEATRVQPGHKLHMEIFFNCF